MPPFPADEGAAPADELTSSMAVEAPFDLFAAGAGLAKRMQTSSLGDRNKAKHESSTYWSLFEDSSSLRPNLKPESLQLGSASGGPEAEGTSGGLELASDRPGTRADPGEPAPTCPSL